MKEKIFNNFSLKVLSVLCAIILWTVIVNIYDPNTGVTFSSITVDLLNADVLAEKGYAYEIVDGSKISVYVSGPKSIITDIKASDIMATADLRNITAYTEYVDIDVKIVKDGNPVNNISVTPKTTVVKLNIQNRTTQQFDVELEVGGSVQEGYVITKQSITPSIIKITGSSKDVQRVAFVKAICDVTGCNSNFQQVVPVVLYDSEGNVIDDSNLELSKKEIEYNAEVGNYKNIPIRYSLEGKPADGYQVESIEISSETATVVGNEQTVNSINEIVIPSAALKVEELKADKTFRIWLSDYLPSDVSVVGDNMITINVKVSNINAKSIVVKPENIIFENLASGLKATVDSSKEIKLEILAEAEIMNKLTADDVKVSVNMAGLDVGKHSVTIKLIAPAECKLEKNYSVSVDVEKNSSTQETTTAKPQESQNSSQSSQVY